eukprot:jgi/Chrzof1/1384/Cz10g05190.t1
MEQEHRSSGEDTLGDVPQHSKRQKLRHTVPTTDAASNVPTQIQKALQQIGSSDAPSADCMRIYLQGLLSQNEDLLEQVSDWEQLFCGLPDEDDHNDLGLDKAVSHLDDLQHISDQSPTSSSAGATVANNVQTGALQEPQCRAMDMDSMHQRVQRLLSKRLSSVYEALQQEVAALKAAASAADDREGMKDKQLQHLQEKLQTEQHALNALKISASQASSAATTAIHVLKVEVGEMSGRAQQAVEANQQLRAQLEAATSTLATAQQQLTFREKDMAQLALTSSELASARQQLQQREQETAQLAAATGELASTKQQLQLRDNELAAFRQHLNQAQQALGDQLARTRQQMLTKQQQLATTLKHLAEAQQDTSYAAKQYELRIATITVQLNDATVDAQAQKQTAVKLADDLHQCTQELGESQQQLSLLKQHMTALQAKMSTAKENQLAAKKQLADAKQEAAAAATAAQQTIANLENQLIEQKAESKRLSLELLAANKKRDEVQQALKEAETTRIAAESKQREYEGQLAHNMALQSQHEKDTGTSCHREESSIDYKE